MTTPSPTEPLPDTSVPNPARGPQAAGEQEARVAEVLPYLAAGIVVLSGDLDVCFVNTLPIKGRATGRSPLQARDKTLA